MTMRIAAALLLILSARAPPAKFADHYRENLRALLEAKIQGQELEQPAPGPAFAPVVDTLAALKSSLSRQRQPAVLNHKQRRAPEVAMARRRRAAAFLCADHQVDD